MNVSRNLPMALTQRDPILFGAGEPCFPVSQELLPHPDVIQSVQLVSLDFKGSGTKAHPRHKVGSLCLGLWQ